jgi:hypothetical protein
MKKPIFFLLLTLLALRPLEAQRQLPPSLVPYATGWSSSFTSLFQRAGFDLSKVDALKRRMPVLESRSSALRLDSTIRFVAYPDSLPLVRNAFNYPLDGVVVDTESDAAGESWIPYSQTVTYSDELGRDLDIIAFRHDPVNEAWVPDSRLEIFPRGDSPVLVDSFIVSAWNTEIGEYVRQLATWRTFDESDRVIEEVTSIEFFEFPFFFRDYYTYDDEGRLASIESFNDDGTVELPAGLETYEYEGFVLTAVNTLVSDGLGGYMQQDRVTYDYLSEGLTDTVTTFRWDIEKETWQEVRQEDFDYDDENRLVTWTATFLDEEGNGQRDRQTYAYLQDEQYAVTTEWFWNDAFSTWAIDERTWYYYEDILSAPSEPRPVPLDLNVWPNPTSGLVQLGLEGTDHLVSVYGLSGQLLRQVRLPGSDLRIDLSALPAGVYQIMVRNSEGHFAGRVLVQ